MKYAALVLACAPVFAFAQSANTITFTGEVAQSTCNVAINGATAASVIKLPTIGKNEFTSAGVAKGWTKFDMALTGCSTTFNTFNTKFTPGALSAGSNIANTAAPSTNVHLQLTSVVAGAEGSVIPFTGGSGIALGGNFTGVQGNKSATVSYGVRYMSENGPANAGKVAGSATYSFIYQ